MPKKKRSTPVSSKQSLANATIKAPQVGPPNLFFTKIIAWLDAHLLFILTGFLFVFIPLYPKIPLADIIPGYIVRLRLEDVFVAITVGFFGIQVIRKKVEWKTPFTWIILAYAVVGLLSTVSGVFITKTIPLDVLHIGKSLLHYFRYLEYFSLFFITYAAVRSKRDVYTIVTVMVVTVLALSIYGYGQRYYYWPVYSTMNREFSKGMRLYLTEHARVQSTFGGHYDMSAYLVVVLPFLLSLLLLVKKRLMKIPLGVVFFAGVWLMIMGASRTSFVAMYGSFGIVILGIAVLQKNLLHAMWYIVSRTIVIYAIIGYMFISYGDSIYERLMQTLQAYPQLNDTYHTLNDRRRHFYRDQVAPRLITIGLVQLKMPEAKKPENGISTDEVAVLVSSDERPTPVNPLPSDVYVDVPDIIYEATTEGGVATVAAREVPRTYSQSAQQYGLSMAIRLDTLWPRALQGFYTNPLFGSGYATLTKESIYQFTEAESTDNNFLRTLGETGAFGFVTFYGTVVTAVFFAVRTFFLSRDRIVRSLLVGFVAGTTGLLLNALFIDVFAASKVAFTYWMITGVVIAIIFKRIEFEAASSHTAQSAP